MADSQDTASGSPAALIVAHGQPSAPEGPEADLAAFAGRVSRELPGWRVRGTTLAAPGALAAAVAALGPGAIVYPLFMADGWFVGTHLPERLAEAGAQDTRLVAPLGLDPGLPVCMAGAAAAAAREMGHAPGEVVVLLAAHGSPSNPRPRRAAEAAARAMGAATAFREIRCGFVDEAPTIAEVAAGLAGPALCMPFFARRNGHVLEDLPQGLAQGGFPGPVLDPIGLDPAVPAMVAQAIRSAADTNAARTGGPAGPGVGRRDPCRGVA